MESNNELKKINIENRKCYFFNDIIKFEDFDLDNIIIDEESYENILVYNVSYKTLIGVKPLRIGFDKIHDLCVYDGTRYLVLYLIFSMKLTKISFYLQD